MQNELSSLAGRGSCLADRYRADIAAAGFALAPLLVIWETTQSCDLACKHCRAEAVTHRHPLELTTEEARRMMARAYAVTGDVLESEPSCAHVPTRYRRMVEAGEAEPVEVYFERPDRSRLSPPSAEG